jgi:hypothetical protein
MFMSQTKHSRTLRAIFTKPTQSNIIWTDIEKMLEYLGAEISEGEGSRVRIALKGTRATFHRPHPRKEADKGSVKSMQNFLNKAGIHYDEI